MAYIPNKVIFPGYTLEKVLRQEGLTQKDLSKRTGISEKHLSNIINGKASITAETAILLENALGGKASFWINLESNHQETVARVARNNRISLETEMVDEFRYKELSKIGYVEVGVSIEKQVENLWRFFQVNSLKDVKLTEAVAYRRGKCDKTKCGAIAAWLRCGELEAKKANLPNFSKSKLKAALPMLKLLSVKNASQFSKEIVEILHAAGVCVAYIPHFKGVKVSGAVRWVGKNPILQLSLYNCWSDIFWFNLYHELGHLVLHGKKGEFLEFDDKTLLIAQEKERAADKFASNQLIPSNSYEKFVANPITSASICAYAQKLGIHPGIVAGRVAHEEKKTWPEVSHLRDRLTFA